jgi:cytochrome c551/c552
MRKSLWMGGVLAVLSVAAILYGQTGGKPPQSTGNPQRAFLDQYCVSCHNVDDNVAGLKLDTINLNRIADNAETWERVVRKLRTGMMPPVSSESPKPPAAPMHTMIGWLENELDRNSKPFLPPSSLHRVNRTE